MIAIMILFRNLNGLQSQQDRLFKGGFTHSETLMVKQLICIAFCLMQKMGKLLTMPIVMGWTIAAAISGLLLLAVMLLTEFRRSQIRLVFAEL